ncbi:N-formylglutamate amidohydrolase [Pseudenhygromyxa sp. WMMC2535]|uniref:N-formylglutamate amidohydrolase n=1 Tax=Pseudenhygromyxa sp. WMMC2535 TaxID=2712867 RepID=UPI001551A791|nr:N-formylglutamate amidohydrolase [Pseudenhygromyxa sp. WMMC2535]NVB39192.1 N-formylglutamate amidohydrolase [Pseudenhygromyxa sp. WMMC2535]
MPARSRFDFDRPCDPPLVHVDVAPSEDAQLPEPVRDRVVVYAVHDGQAIPPRFRVREDGSPIVDPEELDREFVRMRDWGANIVAEELAAALGISSYASCRVARVLLDFNRFPGSTPLDNEDALEAMAIAPVFGRALDHRQKTDLLESCYDPISAAIETLVADSLIGISVHTYDEAHRSNNKRAHVSIINLALSYQRHARLPFGVFDPMYPDHLAESTCSRILRDRMSLNLERSGFRVTHNHPYALPDGSIEMRAQVWHFFRYLRRRFEAEHPEIVGHPAYERVFTMLSDTNLRMADAEELRSFLHRFRRAHNARRGDLLAALGAYEHIAAYVRDSSVVQDYRRSPERPSSVGIEVRKDLVCSFDPETGMPQPTSPEQREVARQIAQCIASSIRTYFATDRQVYETTPRAPLLDDEGP